MSITWPSFKLTVILDGLEHFCGGPFDRLLRNRETDIVEVLGTENARDDGLARLLHHAAQSLTPRPFLPGTPKQRRG